MKNIIKKVESIEILRLTCKQWYHHTVNFILITEKNNNVIDNDVLFINLQKKKKIERIKKKLKFDWKAIYISKLW